MRGDLIKLRVNEQVRGRRLDDDRASVERSVWQVEISFCCSKNLQIETGNYSSPVELKSQ